MIFKYKTTTLDPMDPNKQTHWFDIQIQNACWTSITVGTDADGNITHGSKTFFDLSSDEQRAIEETVKGMVKRLL